MFDLGADGDTDLPRHALPEKASFRYGRYEKTYPTVSDTVIAPCKSMRTALVRLGSESKRIVVCVCKRFDVDKAADPCYVLGPVARPHRIRYTPMGIL